jgi:hypothetical protein
MEGTDFTPLPGFPRIYFTLQIPVRHMPGLVLWLCVGLRLSSGTSASCPFVIRQFICLTFVSWLELLHGLFAPYILQVH